MRARGLVLVAILSLALSACAQKPKGSFVERVREVCGPRIAAGYANTKWKDRDYAQDYFLGTCILFPGDTKYADQKGSR
jgi:hypothetical protein